MEPLLEVLLAAARGGAAYEAHQAEPVALLPLAQSIASRRGTGPHELEFTGDPAATWVAPRAAIVTILRNVITNALEYTPATGRIRIAAERINGQVRFAIQNGPVDLHPDHTERIFEPFWRTDQSRTDRTHRGMGLYVVDCLCQSLHVHRTARVLPSREFQLELIR